jgi:hypothetical protein
MAYIPSGIGRLVAIHHLVCNMQFNDFSFLENDYEIGYDGLSFESTGSEDFFLSVGGYPAGVSIGTYTGVSVYQPSLSGVMQYRDFYGECGGFPFNINFVLVYHNTEYGGSLSYAYWVLVDVFV